jgi:hypothetical protein
MSLFGTPIQVTSNTTLSNTDNALVQVDSSQGAITVTLNNAANVAVGSVIQIKGNGSTFSNHITINVATGDTIDGNVTQRILSGNWACLHLVNGYTDGSTTQNWFTD